jgi:hypothetical protein
VRPARIDHQQQCQSDDHRAACRRWLLASRGPGGAVCSLADAQLLRLAAELDRARRAAVGRLES